MDSTALVTFLLQTPITVHSAALRGSWDNFANAYPMQKDFRKGKGHWRGCHSFRDIICDGDSQATLRRNGALKMGERYWYYFQVDGDEDYHNPGQPYTTACPYLPGQPVHVLDMPVESPAEDRNPSEDSIYSSAFTMNPEDKYLTPRAAPTPGSSHGLRLSRASHGSSRKRGRSKSPLPARSARRAWTSSKGKSINFSRLLRRPSERQKSACTGISGPDVRHSAGAVMQSCSQVSNPAKAAHARRPASFETIKYCSRGGNGTFQGAPQATARPQSSHSPNLENASPLGSHPLDASIRRECESLTRRYRGMSANHFDMPVYFLPSSAGSESVSEQSSEEIIQIGLLDEPEKSLLASIESSSQATEIEDDGEEYAEYDDIEKPVRSPSPCSSEKLSRIPTIAANGKFSPVDLLNKRLPEIPQSPPPETVWSRSHSRSRSLDVPLSNVTNGPTHVCRPRSKSSPRAPASGIFFEITECEDQPIDPLPKRPLFSPRPELKSHFSDWTTTTAASADSPAATQFSPTLGVEADFVTESPSMTTDSPNSPQSYFGLSEQTTPALSTGGYSVQTDFEQSDGDQLGRGSNGRFACLSQHLPAPNKMLVRHANDPAFITDSTDTLSSLTGLRIDTFDQRHGIDSTQIPSSKSFSNFPLDQHVEPAQETQLDTDTRQTLSRNDDAITASSTQDERVVSRDDGGLDRQASTRSKFSIPLMVDLDLPDPRLSLLDTHSPTKDISPSHREDANEFESDPEAFYLHCEYRYPTVPRPTSQYTSQQHFQQPFSQQSIQPEKRAGPVTSHSRQSSGDKQAYRQVSETYTTPTAHHTSTFTSPESKTQASEFKSPAQTDTTLTPLTYYSPFPATTHRSFCNDHDDYTYWSRDSVDSPGVMDQSDEQLYMTGSGPTYADQNSTGIHDDPLGYSHGIFHSNDQRGADVRQDSIYPGLEHKDMTKVTADKWAWKSDTKEPETNKPRLDVEIPSSSVGMDLLSDLGYLGEAIVV